MKRILLRAIAVIVINIAAVRVYEPVLYLFVPKPYGDGGIGQGILIVLTAGPCLIAANVLAGVLLKVASKRGLPPGAVLAGYLPVALFAVLSLVVPALVVPAMPIDRELRTMALINAVFFTVLLHGLSLSYKKIA